VGKTKAKSVLLQVTLVHSAHFPAVTVDFELVGTLVEIQPEIAEVEVSRLNVTLLGRSLRRSSHHHQAPGRLAAESTSMIFCQLWPRGSIRVGLVSSRSRGDTSFIAAYP
jgi:hypothetical protein